METQHHTQPTTTGTLSRRTALRGLGGAGIATALGLAAAGRATLLVGRSGHAGAAPAADPAAVIASYAAAANAHDLDRILAHYADDAIHVFLPTADGSAGICRGKNDFRIWYEQSIVNQDRIEVVDGTLKVDGDRAAFALRMTSGPWTKLGLDALEADAEAVVVDGLIRTHMVMLTPASLRQLLAASGIAPALPADGEQPKESSAHLGHLGH
jgi:ketosteroid isomerase-like protein